MNKLINEPILIQVPANNYVVELVSRSTHETKTFLVSAMQSCFPGFSLFEFDVDPGQYDMIISINPINEVDIRVGCVRLITNCGQFINKGEVVYKALLNVTMSFPINKIIYD